MLQIRDLTVTMKKDLRDLLRGFTFALNPGDKAAIIGEEGNGKSTLLKLLYDPALVEGYVEYTGAIQKDGMLLGYLSQEVPPEQGELSAYEFCCQSPAFLDASPGELAAAAKRLRFPLDWFYSDRLVKTFSGGEKVKLRMALLTLGRPDCYLLDEPSNDLDIDTLDWLETFIRECAQPVLFISHDELLLERTANVILHMEQLRRKTLPRWTVARMGYRQYVEERGEEEGLAHFQGHCYVTPPKAELAHRVLRAQGPAVEALRENDFSLYVSIPFCPTRCAYCSFVSQDMEHAKKLMDPYFQLLLEEIEKVAQVTKDLGLSLVSVYIGGGTPTTLSAQQLSALCGKIRQVFDFSRCGEFTVEAGRQDTITQEKLLALREADISRISINPQSLSDQVLRNIGRRHTAQDVVEAFRLAQRLGFSNINADLIVGLPGDDLASFQRTLNGVIQLGASNVTVHSLAIKRSARLNSPGGDLSAHSNAQEAAAMVDYSIQRLTQEGFEPYYLYRQTRMAGNLENTGWAKPGSICRYNIYTMDESNTVIACGAGGVSKVKDPYSGRLERIFNFKLPLEYINRFPEILQRKDGVTALYEQFRQRLR